MISLSILDKTFNDISTAYYSNGQAQIPSTEQINQIAADTADMKLVGKLVTGAGPVGIAVSYIISGIPYVGPVLSVVGMVTSVGVGILGLDMQRASQNLQVFADSSTLKTGKNILHQMSQGSDGSEKKFKMHIFQTAVRDTVIAESILTIYVNSNRQ